MSDTITVTRATILEMQSVAEVEVFDNAPIIHGILWDASCASNEAGYIDTTFDRAAMIEANGYLLGSSLHRTLVELHEIAVENMAKPACRHGVQPYIYCSICGNPSISQEVNAQFQ